MLLLRDVLARSLFERYHRDFPLLKRILAADEPAANRIANTVAVSFVAYPVNKPARGAAHRKEELTNDHRSATGEGAGPGPRSDRAIGWAPCCARSPTCLGSVAAAPAGGPAETGGRASSFRLAGRSRSAWHRLPPRAMPGSGPSESLSGRDDLDPAESTI